MPYVGRQSIIGNFVKLDSITVVNGQAAYTMQNGGVNFTSYDNVNQFLVSLNGVLQAPTDSFTVSGSTLTFASNLSTGDVIDFVLVLGNSLDIGTPSDNTVTSAKIASEAVTPAKLGYDYNQYRNIIINGDMSIAQRSTSETGLTTGGYRTVDRFNFGIATAGTWTITQDSTVPTGQGFAKSTKLDCTTANASLSASSELTFFQKIEGQNLQYLKKGTSNAESVTLSFWVRSNKTGTYTAEIFDNDNSRQISKTYTISSADTWEKKTITFAGDTTGALDNDNAVSFWIFFWLGAGSNYTSGTLNTSWNSSTTANRVSSSQVNLADSTSNEWYITGVQLEAGTTASDFEFLPTDVNQERCFRYYQKSYNISTAPGNTDNNNELSQIQMANTSSTTANHGVHTKFIKRLRGNPTMTIYAPDGTSGNLNYNKAGSATSEVGGSVTAGCPTGFRCYTTNASSLTVGQAVEVRFHYTADAEL